LNKNWLIASTILLLLILPWLREPASINSVDASINSSSVGLGGLVEIGRWVFNNMPISYGVAEIGGKIYIIYVSTYEVRVFNNSIEIRLEIAGSPRYVVYQDYIILYSVYNGLEIAVINPIENTTVHEVFESLYWLSGRLLTMYHIDNGLKMYFEINSLNTKYLAVASYSFQTNRIVLENVSELYGSIIYSNIAYCKRFNEQPEYRDIDQLVKMVIQENYVYVVTDGLQYIQYGSLAMGHSLICINSSIYMFFDDNDNLHILKYSGGSYTGKAFSRNKDNGILYRVDLSDNYLILIYKYSEGYRALYVDPVSLDALNYEELVGEDIINTYMDLDGDGFPEYITYVKPYFQLYYTSSGVSHRVYWDYLMKYIYSIDSVVLLNNTLYISMVFKDRDIYILELLKNDSSRSIDYTPPTIVIKDLGENSVVGDSVEINISAYDDESSVYCINVSIYRGSELIYVERVYNDSFQKIVDLDNGVYYLIIDAWNMDGSKASASVVFYVVKDPVEIIEPANWSVVKPTIDLQILSNGSYNVSIFINDTYLHDVSLTPGLNTILLNCSGFPAGIIIVKLVMLEANYSVSLILTIDDEPPTITVNGLTNETTIHGILNISIDVYDEHFEQLIIYIDDKIVFNTSFPGVYNVPIYTWRYGNGYHEIVILAYDQAGNVNKLYYRVLIMNVGEPFLEIEPEPVNNTFVSGVLIFNLYGRNVSRIAVFVNGSLFYQESFDQDVFNTTIEIDTRNWFDDTYMVVFNATGFDGTFIIKRYIWFIDNNPPYVYMHIPAYGWGGVWRNNTFVPRFHPQVRDIVFIKDFNGKLYFTLYINISDRWLDHGVLYINDSTAYMLYDGSAIPVVLNRSMGYLLDIMVPGEGYYLLKMVVMDHAGHVSSYWLGAYFDLTPPDITLYGYGNNSFVNKHSLNISLIVHDQWSDHVVVGVNIQLNNYSIPSLDSYTPIAPYPIIPINYNTSIPIELREDGVYYLTFIAVDRGMNYATKLYVLTIDTTPPEINASLNTSDSCLTISLRIHDNLSGSNNATIYLNNTLIETVCEEFFEKKYVLEPNTYVLKIIAIDRAGNEAVYTTSFTIKQAEINQTNTNVEGVSETKPIEKSGSGVTGGYSPIPIILVLAIGLVIIYLFIRRKR